MINRTYEGDAEFEIGGRKSQWERFANEVYLLNYRAPSNVQYKVVFIGRHGDGLHNDAESYYGTPAWNVSHRFLLGSICNKFDLAMNIFTFYVSSLNTS